ncbi:glycoside hydrolase family 108 protein [Profundibacterium mesophilum]|uniref:Secretion activating protein General function prediction only n=1 Tax=Profundibacterium mesophilum KAUST100406-0324 TaxID=1037889 RepID=A0A921TE55_9RHOB|nr:glycoside hydrolase family 108 protein [Profundibacterium mesophilum]KAF0675059.1 putative secretion activating protein General function prediction only [Profundibacterium mesophilum KAUST100406-0324]
MLGNFERVHPWVLAYEGGYVDHPKDPGGATNEGITQATYDAYRRRAGLPKLAVRHLTPAERDTIYRTQYWDTVRCDDLPAGVDFAVYDFAVNSGPARAARYLQQAAGLQGREVDGIVGLRTLAAVAAVDPVTLIGDICGARMRFLRRLSTWGTFGRGWSRRVVGQWEGVQASDSGTLDRATMLARSVETIPAPTITDDGAGAKTDGRTSIFAAIFSALAKIFGRR